MSSIATISKGKTGIKDATPGQYPLVVTAEARGSSDYFDFEGPGVMIPMVSSTGHGDASLKRVHYQDGKYAVGSILAVVQPRDPEELSARYLHAYLSTFKDELLVSRMVGTANVSLTVAKISGVPIPLIPISAQRKIEELMALCDRLDARQADADSAHAQLVQALLDSLTQARDADDFAHSWQRLAEHFHTLFTTEPGIDALKQTLLQLAVMGKLVPQDPNDEPASELLKRIAEEKARLVVEGKINKQKPLAAFDEEAAPFELPAGWKWTSLAQVAVVNPRNAAADSLEISFVPMTFIGTRFDGQHAQETRLWAKVKQGFTHFAEGDVGVAKITPCFENSKACVFSNLVNGLGAGTTELHVVRPVCQTLDPRYVLAYLKSPQFLLVGETKMTGTAGQKRLPKNFVETNPFPLPPLAEQHRIVAKVDELMALCDQLKARLGEARQVHGNLANALIGQALNGEKEPRAEAVYFSAYLISKLASRRTFGRVAHMKLLFLADSHLGLGLMDGYRRHAAGPLDTSIYRVEERAAKEGLYSTSIEVLKSGQEKVSYHIGANISRAVETAASALGSARKELDRLIALFEGRKTDDLEAVATLYAVWNDALAGGLHPSDEWLINEFRSNWHEAKERFTPDVLGRWLGWMRDNGLVPTGNSATTKSQAAFLFN
ncbi:restriction endonuclease subunit S [Xanthomonas oryzae]|uniref:restriction endonuclease subunit S n=1 Tax=Xanthomonas oryzae TaxID=347 RepID=UPI0018A2588B|nr:restriction endonuclease subunit S [Xanthomonas oryzae]WVN05737.1 restriction endonuclease subunit S [Xanthomonas oryzae pv. oryzicola]